MLLVITIAVLLWIALRVRRSIVELEATVRDLKARVSAIEQLPLKADTPATVRLKPDTTTEGHTTTEVRLKPDTTIAEDVTTTEVLLEPHTTTEARQPVIAAEASALPPQTTTLATETATGTGEPPG